MTTGNSCSETVCACPSSDARLCFQIRYQREDDEYEHGERCECSCHDDDTEDSDYFADIGDPFK